MSGAVFESCFDYSGPIVYYPVRHHSPACSYHLKKVIAEYKPQCILIEGPEDADFLIKYLGGDEIKPPVCIYASYDDKKGIVSENKDKYRAYYPFLDYSPELTAIREGVSADCSVHFIDMPYGLQLVQFGESRAVRFFSDDNSQLYYSRIAEKSGCRSFSEFWEKSFEVNGMYTETSDFVKNVFMLGKYMRELTPSDEKNRFRECFMRRNIGEYSKSFNKILVVAGAYHIDGLVSETEQLKFKKYDIKSAAHYLMPYSFAEADSRSGYGAGIPFPAFYSSVWKKLTAEKEKPYDESARDFIIKASRYARGKTHSVSVSDEIQAMYMASELAALRGKSEAGAYELIDGVKSAFVKGDITTSASMELDFLYRQMTGVSAGEVNVSADEAAVIPPCIMDFRAQCRKFRINTGNILKQQITLDVIKNHGHYQKSCFLHRMEYLKTGFCRVESGPDFVSGKDTSLVREQWGVRYGTSVEAKLIDLSVYGSTVEGICRSLLREQSESVQNSEAVGAFLLRAYMLGFSDTAASFFANGEQILRDDTDFLSQYGFMRIVGRLLSLQRTVLSGADERVLGLLRISFSVALAKLEDIRCTDGETAERVCEGIRLMYSLVADYPQQCSRSELLSELEKCTASGDTKPMIYGVCLSICAKSGLMGEEDYCNTVVSYMLTADGVDAADFLTGVISVGRDIVFTDDSVLFGIDYAVGQMEHEKFMGILPQLRRAFTSFLPAETSRISKKIADKYGVSEEQLSGSLAFSEKEIMYASQCDERIRMIMEKWEMQSGGEKNE